MAKTVELSDIKIQSIIINVVVETDPDGNEVQTGYSSTITYFVIDKNDKPVLSNATTKYTIGTSFQNTLSEESDTLVKDLVNTMTENMRAREELDS